MKRLCAAVGVVAVGCAPGIASASTALILGGAGRYADLTDEELAQALGGYFAEYDERVNVPFAGTDDFGESIDAAGDSMYDAVYATPGKKTIGGVSQTAPAIAEVLRRLENDPDAPPPTELDAAMYGAPSPFFYRLSGVEYQSLPETPYNLLVVTAEYDGIADFPDNPFNLLAVVNAVMGYNQLHYPAAFTDISDVPEEYVTTTTNSKGGTTTTVLIPTRVLPLLKPLSDVGVSDEAVAYLDKILRPLVDSAYDRHKADSANPEAPEADRRSLSAVAETETETETEGADSQSLSHDTESRDEAAGEADSDTTDDVSEGRHAKKDDVQRGKHAKADADDTADKQDKADSGDAADKQDKADKDDAQRGKHAKADKDDDADKGGSRSDKAGSSDAAA